MVNKQELRGPVALVLNDMINSNLRTPDDPARVEQVDANGFVPRTVELVQAARDAGIPVFWIQVERRADRADVVDTWQDWLPRRAAAPKPPILAGSHRGANIDELPVQPDDHVVFKPRMDPFIGTELDIALRSRGVRTILFGGYATNGGVESGIRTAHDLNYDVVTVSDCCYNVEEDAHEFTLTRVLPYYSRVRSLAETQTMIRDHAWTTIAS